MKKNIVVAFFISIFLLVVVLAIFSVFKIKKVAVDFNVAENCVYDTEKIQEKLDGCLDKNLLLFDTDKVEDILADYPYLEIKSVTKSFPNHLLIELKERQKVYFVNYLGENYILDKNGFVTEKTSVIPKDLIEIKISVENATVGQKLEIKQSEVDLFNLGLSVIYNENFTNTVDYIEVVVATEKQDLVLGMTTGVRIEVIKATVRWQDKISAGLKCYNDELTDRHKYTHDVLVFELDDGNLSVTHTERSQENG